MRLIRRSWQGVIDLLPINGFYFDRPLILFQSDDWGRIGVRDQEGMERLRSGGVHLGERPYDFYSLETSEDLSELCAILRRHHDSSGRHPCLEMNFVLANLDFSKMSVAGWQQIRILPLADGLPEEWSRPGLFDAYREGIADGVFCSALHGTTHFCQKAVERNLVAGGARATLLRTLWQAGTPYIHWRMPWIGYEYWDPEKAEDHRFLPAAEQREAIGQAIGLFARMFSSLPRSACAPGYRANDDTQRAWAQHGIRVAQNGPGDFPAHFDRNGILQLSRTVEFEPATDPSFSLEACLQSAERCFERGLPVVVSVHSINFHSTVRDFRSRTLKLLDEFLSALESKHRDLLYLHDGDVYELIQNGRYETAQGSVSVNVSKKRFAKSQVRKRSD